MYAVKIDRPESGILPGFSTFLHPAENVNGTRHIQHKEEVQNNIYDHTFSGDASGGSCTDQSAHSIGGGDCHQEIIGTSIGDAKIKAGTTMTSRRSTPIRAVMR